MLKLNLCIYLFIYISDDGSDLTIVENSRWKVAENGSLIFKKISKDDEGVYTCDVSNGVGEGLRKSARLNVKGKLFTEVHMYLLF